MADNLDRPPIVTGIPPGIPVQSDGRKIDGEAYGIYSGYPLLITFE